MRADEFQKMSPSSSAKIGDLLAKGRTLSFEFFPPATQKGSEQLNRTLEALSALNPAFVSVTTGAGGGKADTTRDLVTKMQQQYPFPVMAHLTCAQHSRPQIRTLLDDYTSAGVSNILALAGDPPEEAKAVAALESEVSGQLNSETETEKAGDKQSMGSRDEKSEETPSNTLRYASELVAEIRSHPAAFGIGVAAHPEVHPRSASRETDRRYLAEKLAAADFAITQFFFDKTHYLRLRDELAALGCHKPVIPGIMPVTSPDRIAHFAKMNGTRIDQELWNRLTPATPQDRQKIATDYAITQCQELLAESAPGLHFYSMNRPEVCLSVLRELAV